MWMPDSSRVHETDILAFLDKCLWYIRAYTWASKASGCQDIAIARLHALPNVIILIVTNLAEDTMLCTFGMPKTFRCAAIGR
jgi:hypothetical protein